MMLYLDNFVIFIVFLLHIIVLNPIFFSANFGITNHSEVGYWEHQVEEYTEQRKPQDRVELVRDNNFDTFSKHDKYIVLKYRFVPEANFNFPKTFKNGYNRSCKRTYLFDSSFPSSIGVKIMAVYCIYCVLFFPKDRRSILGAFGTYWEHLWMPSMALYTVFRKH